uniref:Uncharacterized protein n=1 Tax=Mycena chlorophos TaxID=658473 RepID=A0ABQ0L716_MYCCL|nr:predicted protein [Mycena chlorophos]
MLNDFFKAVLDRFSRWKGTIGRRTSMADTPPMPPPTSTTSSVQELSASFSRQTPGYNSNDASKKIDRVDHASSTAPGPTSVDDWGNAEEQREPSMAGNYLLSAPGNTSTSTRLSALVADEDAQEDGVVLHALVAASFSVPRSRFRELPGDNEAHTTDGADAGAGNLGLDVFEHSSVLLRPDGFPADIMDAMLFQPDPPPLEFPLEI